MSNWLDHRGMLKINTVRHRLAPVVSSKTESGSLPWKISWEIRTWFVSEGNSFSGIYNVNLSACFFTVPFSLIINYGLSFSPSFISTFKPRLWLFYVLKFTSDVIIIKLLCFEKKKKKNVWCTMTNKINKIDVPGNWHLSDKKSVMHRTLRDMRGRTRAMVLFAYQGDA